VEHESGRQRPSPEEREARNGFLVGLGLLALSGYVLVTGWFIPNPETWQTAPALLPLVLAGGLFIMAGLITLDTIREGALRALFDIGGGSAGGVDGRPLWRTLFAMVAIGVFFFVLLRFLKFEIAAFLFLIVMMRMYWHEGKLYVQIAVAAVLPFILSGMFEGLFGTPMPGNGNLMQDLMYWLRH
jgi:hypothetical protein